MLALTARALKLTRTGQTGTEICFSRLQSASVVSVGGDCVTVVPMDFAGRLPYARHAVPCSLFGLIRLGDARSYIPKLHSFRRQALAQPGALPISWVQCFCQQQVTGRTAVSVWLYLHWE